MPDFSEVPFPRPTVPLLPQLDMNIEAIYPTSVAVSCAAVNNRQIIFISRVYLPFLIFLNTSNHEIDGIEWETETRPWYWNSLRAYLNMLLEDTLDLLQRCQEPKSLACWLRREYVMCKHNDSGRREYAAMTRSEGLHSSIDVLTLSMWLHHFHLHHVSKKYITKFFAITDWISWCNMQVEAGYYSEDSLGEFSRRLKQDLPPDVYQGMWLDLSKNSYKGPNLLISLINSLIFAGDCVNEVASNQNQENLEGLKGSQGNWFLHFI
jgi:hypothetical protein